MPFYNYLRSNLLLYIRYYFLKYMKAGLKLNIQKTKILVPSPITSWQIDGGKMKTVTDFIFLDSKITVDGNCSHGVKTLVPWKKSYDQPKQQRHHFADKGAYSHSCGFSSSHEWIWELDHEEAWAVKSWCIQTVVLDTSLEYPLDSKIKPVNPTENQPWVFIGRTDSEVETPILWPWCKEPTHWKRPWCQERLRVGGEGSNRGWDGRSLSSVWLFATQWSVVARVLCSWNSPGKNTGVGCHFLLQGLSPTQELNSCLLHLLHW